METPSNDMRGFYRQRKSGIAKPTSKSNPKKPKSTTKSNKNSAATVGSDVTQPTALLSHGSLDLQDDYNRKEQVLRQFDMNMAYGPCIGMTRLARWERAKGLGLNPPAEIESLLKSEKVQPECLWDGCV